MIRRFRQYRVRRRWLVVLALLACVVFHAVLVARYLLSPEQFRARTQLLLQSGFPGGVRVGRASYAFPSGFRLKDLRVQRPPARGGGELFRAKALSVDLGFLALLRGRVAVDELLLEEPELELTRADFAEMKQPRPEEGVAPLRLVVIRGGRIVLGKDLFFEGSPERELRDVQMELTQERRLANGYAFEGEANSSLWGRCQLEGTLDLGGRRLDARAVARGITIDKRLRELLPKEYQSYGSALDMYNLAGAVDLAVEASVSWAAGGSSTLKAVVDLRDCSAAWERFPVKCTSIRGRVEFDGANIHFRDLTGRAGPATVTLSGQSTPEKIEVHLVGRGRPLDKELYDAAPPPLKRVWERCGIEGGIINADYESTWWRAQKRYEATIRADVRDVRATYKFFPYPLSDIAGTVRWENQVSYVDGLHGRCGNARVAVRGRITDAGVPDLVIEASSIPFDDTLRKAVTANPKRAYDYGALFDELRPEGAASVQCWVTTRDGDPDKPLFRFAIRPEGASFQHKDFPHRFTDVRGDILVDEAGTVSFRQLSGRLGATRVDFLGGVRAGPKGPLPDITVVAPEVELGLPVRALLPKEWAAVYDDLAPQGKVSFTWRLAADETTGAPRRTTEVACLQECSVQHKLFPLRITGLMGRFRVDEGGRATFTGMRGRIGNAPIEAISGQALPGGLGGLSFTLRARGLALDDTLRAALPEAWQKVWADVRPSGEAIVEYQFAGNPDKPDRPTQRMTIEPTEGAFCYRRFPLPVSEVTRGKVVFDQDGNVKIGALQGKVRGKAVQIGGEVKMGPQGGLLSLDVEAEELVLDDELRRVLPPEWQGLWETLRPAGKIGASATAVVDIQKGEWRSFRLNAALKGCEATWRKVPVRLTGLRGRFDYADGLVTLTDVTGECPVADAVRLSGRISQKGEGGERLQVVAQNVRLVPEFISALPPDLRKTLEAIELKGLADTIDLSFTTTGKGGETTECFGTVRLRDASFRQTYPFEQVSGTIRIDKGTVHPDGTQKFEGGLDLRKLVVMKFVITELKGAYTQTRTLAGGEKAPQSKLALDNLGATFYGGNLSARLDLSGEGAFAGWLSLQSADFKVFCREALGADSDATGALAFRVEFPPARYKDEKGLVGDGEASVTNGELGALPLAASLLNVLGFRSPLDRSITRAAMKFGITKDALLVKQLLLSGETRLLAGQGTIGFDGKLDLRLVSPRSGIELPVISQLLREQLVQVDVRGTLSNPSFTPLPVPVVPQLIEQINDVLGLWRKRQPAKPPAPGPPPAPKQP